MVQDYQCNKVYISALLQKVCPETYQNLIRVLYKHDVRWSQLEGTNGIWCRDYMPLQVWPDCFEGYLYDPDYLQGRKYQAMITDGNELCRKMGMRTGSTLEGIRIDGGNVVKADGRIIMTSKVFEENPQIPISKLSECLEMALGERLIVLPWDTEEIFGHSDGICRYIGNDSILMTNYSQIDPKMAQRFKHCLAPFFRSIKELQFNVSKPCKYNWAYINWLQTDKVLIIPKFNVPEDGQAFEQISELMPQYAERIEMVDTTNLVKHGGALNCCSWTIREELPKAI